MTISAEDPGQRLRAHRPAARLAFVLLTFLAAFSARQAQAGVTPDSPEVQKVVKLALAFLENGNDPRLGAKCLMGLAFVKAGRPDHPRVKDALSECLKQAQENPSEANLDMYSNGLAVIFLCEYSPK